MSESKYSDLFSAISPQPQKPEAFRPKIIVGSALKPILKGKLNILTHQEFRRSQGNMIEKIRDQMNSNSFQTKSRRSKISPSASKDSHSLGEKLDAFMKIFNKSERIEDRSAADLSALQKSIRKPRKSSAYKFPPDLSEIDASKILENPDNLEMSSVVFRKEKRVQKYEIVWDSKVHDIYDPEFSSDEDKPKEPLRIEINRIPFKKHQEYSGFEKVPTKNNLSIEKKSGSTRKDDMLAIYSTQFNEKISKFTKNLFDKKAPNYPKRRDNYSDFSGFDRIQPKTTTSKQKSHGYSTVLSNNLANFDIKKMIPSKSKPVISTATKSITNLKIKADFQKQPSVLGNPIERSLSKSSKGLIKIGFKNSDKNSSIVNVYRGENSVQSLNKIGKSASKTQINCFKKR